MSVRLLLSLGRLTRTHLRTFSGISIFKWFVTRVRSVVIFKRSNANYPSPLVSPLLLVLAKLKLVKRMCVAVRLQPKKLNCPFAISIFVQQLCVCVCARTAQMKACGMDNLHRNYSVTVSFLLHKWLFCSRFVVVVVIVLISKSSCPVNVVSALFLFVIRVGSCSPSGFQPNAHAHTHMNKNIYWHMERTAGTAAVGHNGITQHNTSDYTPVI